MIRTFFAKSRSAHEFLNRSGKQHRANSVRQIEASFGEFTRHIVLDVFQLRVVQLHVNFITLGAVASVRRGVPRHQDRRIREDSDWRAWKNI
jgi:hypothetical protein